MKRLLLPLAFAAICALLSALPAYAQKTFLGGGFLYDNDAERLGFDVRYLPDLKIMDKCTFVPNLDFILGNGNMFFRLDANGHYELLTFVTGGGAYALGGIDLARLSDANHTAMTFGLNMGLGARGHFNPVDVFGEVKYVFGGSFDGTMVTGGILFELK